MMTMPNRRQFIRHTAAFGLTVGLLPVCAAQQEHSTRTRVPHSS